LDGVESKDIKVLADKLGQISDNAATHGTYLPIGELYGFKLSVKTEESQKEGIQFRQNRFFVEGGGHVKHDYNNDSIANDPKLAINYFIRALEKIPVLIDNHEKKIKDLSQDVSVLREIAQSSWRREEELKALKTETAALDRKIQLSLKPMDEEKDKQEKHADIPVISDSQKKEELTEEQKAVQEIQGLFSGKTNMQEYLQKCEEAKNKRESEKSSHAQIFPMPERLNEYKETMNDRSVTCNLSENKIEKQTKGFKI
jgi:hypothetical protein